MISIKGLVPEPEFAGRYRFAFDGFQVEAITHVGAGQSVMVAAPTSAGKTVVAEYALWRAARMGKRAIYTTPIKALSNQKRRELEGLFPGRVGLLTGDRSENRDADVVVMTTEVLRNMLMEDGTALAGVGVVVFDEVHYLADPDRGTIWEESIITCLPHIQLVCLSATIANAREIADWISQTHRPIALVRHDERPVPLDHYAFTGGALRLIREASGRRVASVPRQERKGRGRGAFAGPDDVVRTLRRADLLPAIWFAFTRRGVELDAQRCAEALPEITGSIRHEIDGAIARLLAPLTAEDRNLAQISALVALLVRGVGFHHAGILPPCKEMVEDLFSRGLLSIVCATDTLSVGINMPARTVIISSMSRPVAGLLTPNDFSQLTGRAGRRGIDTRGAVVLLPTPFHDFERSYAVITGPLEPVRSAFTLRYSTMLSIFTGGDPERRLSTLVASSLRQFQLYGDARHAEKELATIDERLSALNGPGSEIDPGNLAEYLTIQGRLTAAEREHEGSRRGKMDRGRRRRPSKASGRLPSEITALRTLLRDHPWHDRAADPEFITANAGRVELLRKRGRLLRRLAEARRERDRDAQQTARAVGGVLRRLEYVTPEGLGRKAAGLKEIVAASGIVISEMYHQDMFDGMGAAELAEVMSWFASDVDRRRYNSFRLSPDLLAARADAEQVFQRVSGLEERHGIRLAQGPSGWLWGMALTWCRGGSIADLSASIELAEGDIVSILNKTIDLLDQFRALLTAYGDYRLLNLSAQARSLLCRGMVAMMRTEGGPQPLTIPEEVL